MEVSINIIFYIYIFLSYLCHPPFPSSFPLPHHHYYQPQALGDMALTTPMISFPPTVPSADYAPAILTFLVFLEHTVLAVTWNSAQAEKLSPMILTWRILSLGSYLSSNVISLKRHFTSTTLNPLPEVNPKS